jgi:ADP-ribose pyrophosphatase YjhB (NUDIX family)
MSQTKKVHCTAGCCTLDIGDYISKNLITRIKRDKKAGCLLYDKQEDAVLLIQSRGNLWGAPKGTLEIGENYTSGAIREVLEETGLKITENMLGRRITIDDKSTYFLVDYKKCDVIIQPSDTDNDANSIGWIKLRCLRQFINNDTIKLTKHTEMILSHFLDV